MAWKERIVKNWSIEEPQRGVLKLLLRLLCLPYSAAVYARNALYDHGSLKQVRLPCPVISVGNIVAGGAGKTPTAIMLANKLRQAGFQPAVLSRGYGGQSSAPVNVVSNGINIGMDTEAAGDEPVLIARSCPGIPVIAGADRVRTGNYAIRHFGADIIILDDGFQHRRLHRDVDIVLVDAKSPFGNGFLLPRGPLREAKTSLRRAHFIVKTGIDEGAGAIAGGKDRSVFNGRRKPQGIIHAPSGRVLPTAYLTGKKICAFAGIAQPDSFKAILQGMDADVALWLPYEDHYRYKSSDIEWIKRRAQEAGVEAIVTTEKDGVKLSKFGPLMDNLYFLRIDMCLAPSTEDFMQAVRTRIQQSRDTQ